YHEGAADHADDEAVRLGHARGAGIPAHDGRRMAAGGIAGPRDRRRRAASRAAPEQATAPMLTSQGICSRYGRTPVLHEVSFRLERGHIGCILGPSGCGKTTLLRCIAGFERISAGEIVSAGVLLSGPGRHVPPEGRRIGMVFQDYALMPHLTALQNVEFGLRGMHAADRRARAM